VTVVRAAGGLLWRPGPRSPRLAVVHRPRYDDWSLPKGKLEPGESFPAAALREVREETRCEARLGPIAGVAWYRVGARLKLVVYWDMDLVAEIPFEPDEEIDALAWLTPRQALARLDHASERRLVARSRRAGPVPAGSPGGGAR
jgi:8-oxo-dGTP pyrophosphatase MutT (NUDIX family)